MFLIASFFEEAFPLKFAVTKIFKNHWHLVDAVSLVHASVCESWLRLCVKSKNPVQKMTSTKNY